MKKLLLLAMLALIPSEGALAQSVTQLPVYIQNNNGQVYDFGNGPLELRVVLGSAQVFTSSGSGLSGAVAASVTMVLTAAPAVPPCVGCLISGAGITPGTTVAGFTGSTITLSAAMTVAANTPVSWGAACPASRGASPVMGIQVGGGDLPLFTSARICGTAQFAAGAQVLPFAIGAH